MWKRKETIGNQTLYLGDCQEVMPLLGKVDAVVTDPPYGIGFQHSGGGTTTGLNNREKSKKLLKSRPLKKKIIGDNKPFDPSFLSDFGKPMILWGANHFANRLPTSGGWLIWDKSQPEKWEKVSFSHCELAWTNSRNTTRIHRQVWMGVVRSGLANSQPVLHPTQKPVELMEWCLGFLPKAQTILDPFMGSGTTLVACQRMGRHGIGVELDEAYFEIACKRVEQAASQPDLLIPETQPKPVQGGLDI
jgi:DNA modification methylase